MKGEYLEGNKDRVSENLIDEYMIIDVRENKSDWNLTKVGVPVLNKCDNCKIYTMKELRKCGCGDVGYCSE